MTSAKALKSAYDICTAKPMRNYLLFLVSFLLVLLLFLAAREVFIILALLAATGLLALIIRPFKTVLSGLELVTFSTVLCSVAYGPKTGMLVGLVFIIINFICMGRFTNYAVVMIPAVMLLGYLSFYLGAWGITAVGIVMTLAYDLIFILGIVTFLGGDMMKGLSYIAVNVIFNIFLFAAVATPVYQLITG